MDEATESPETPHIWIRGEGGSIFKLDLPLHESIQERLLKGYIVRVNEDGSAYAPQDAPSWSRPAVSDSKAAWVGWAAANGMSPDDAEAATKTDLIERFGLDPLPAPQNPEAPENPEPEAQPEGEPTEPEAAPEQ